MRACVAEKDPNVVWAAARRVLSAVGGAACVAETGIVRWTNMIWVLRVLLDKTVPHYLYMTRIKTLVFKL